MDILEYNELDIAPVKSKYQKLLTLLKNDDFYSAEVKKLKNTAYYRAKLDHTHRVLFSVADYNNKKYILILEIIYNHAYDKSRFLNGAAIDESKIITPAEIESVEAAPLKYINERRSTFNVLDKIISFDEEQQEIYQLTLPTLIIGSAGSGKTMLTLEKMKQYDGDILYITHSPYLVQNSRNLYYANQYSNEKQNTDFLSFQEFLETIKVPQGKEINLKQFSAWLNRQHAPKAFKDANKLFEEFKGVLTGSLIDKAHLSREDYAQLGTKQSIYQIDERNQVYDLFERYLQFLKGENLYDSNMLSYHYLPLCEPRYHIIVADEIQDFTTIQLHLILSALRHADNFLLCGDSNQIVHPNFFSWSKIKTLFYQQRQGRDKSQEKNPEKNQEKTADITRILYNNYRNTPNVVDIANKLLKIKNRRFGSIDKESNYLVTSQSDSQGKVYCLKEGDKLKTELNEKTKKSTQFAILVLHDEQKHQVKQHFQTPLVFSIQEAKGLEYENVILFNFISSEEQKFLDIAKGVSQNDLQHDLTYARAKDKTDRSMEIYKFYINSLYVAMTRAIKNIYIIERAVKHPLLKLLGLEEVNSEFVMDVKESTLDDWQREARKLELQGKQEQADEIKKTLLQTKKSTWTIINLTVLEAIKKRALELTSGENKFRPGLLEYAVIYHDFELVHELRALNFKPANDIKKISDAIEKKYFLAYASANTTVVMKSVDDYGVDFRNIFNQTPLMVAARLGHHTLIKQLIDKGANLELTDNRGKSAFQIALLAAYFDKKYASTKLAKTYHQLEPSSISIKVDDKLIKIDNRLMEFFLFNLVSAILYQLCYNRYQPTTKAFLFNGFTTDFFIDNLKTFPNSVLLERRKKREYISSILSKNEMHRIGPYNRKLFLRVARGHYLLNPGLEVKFNDNWINIYELLGLQKVLEKCKKTIPEELAHVQASMCSS